MKFIVSLIFIILNEIIKFFRKIPLISLLVIFGLYVNSLPLPNENIVDIKTPVERNFNIQKALLISGGDSFPLPFSTKRKKIDLVLHARLMKTFPDWKARMNYQKKQEKF
jgi:hypothetical protein